MTVDPYICLGTYLSNLVPELVGTYSGDVCRISIEEPMVLDRYWEPWRFYHDMEHVLHTLKALEPYLRSLTSVVRKKCIVRAVVYHDIYFAPGFPFNEDFSAMLATQHAPKSFRPDEDELVEQYIMSTKDPHRAVECRFEEDTWHIIDADLSGIGKEWEAFEDDSALIKNEFLCAGVSPTDYENGRKKWAAGMLEKRKSFLPADRKVFFTDLFGHLDKRASDNLARAAMVSI